jgi:L-histidine N-alpha-methyltransferase
MSQLNVITKKSKKIICFLGSTIGNLSIEKAQNFLINLNNIMNKEDLLLVGFDMVKNKEIIEKAYNDNKKLTEKFNKNILKVINNHINSNFEINDFDHIAFYNQKLSRIEMHLKAKKNLEIFSSNPSNIFIKKGETIHTENSYKFTYKIIKNLAINSGFRIQKIYTDENKWFSLVQLIKM